MIGKAAVGSGVLASIALLSTGTWQPQTNRVVPAAPSASPLPAGVSGRLAAAAVSSIPDPLPPQDVSSPLGRVSATLSQDYPNIFGGLTVGRSGSFQVAEVGTDAAFEAEAQELMDEVPVQMGVVLPASASQLTFVHVGHSLHQLIAIKHSVLQQIEGVSTPIFSVGLDDLNNRVILGSSDSYTGPMSNNAATYQPLDSVEQNLVSQFGSDLLEFRPGTAPVATGSGRLSDSPPWNGGDEIVLPWLYGYNYCSTGFGVHTNSGAHYMLTAGHCAYVGGNFVNGIHANNTDHNNPQYTAANLVGTINSASVGGQTQASAGIDSALITASSSNIIWTNVNTRVTLTGWATPSVGAFACNEGAIGGELCAYIIQDDTTWEVTDGALPGGVEWVDSLDLLNVPDDIGDSGGPVYWNTQYGPLAAGTLVARNGTDSASMDIDVLLYLWGVDLNQTMSLNTLSSP